MQIVIDRNEIKKRGTQIIGLSSDYDKKIKEIKNITEKIELCWQGEDAKVFINMLNEKCVPALEQIAKMLENFGKYLEQVSDIYNTFENNVISNDQKG